jgi:hypothetical protein
MFPGGARCPTSIPTLHADQVRSYQLLAEEWRRR